MRRPCGPLEGVRIPSTEDVVMLETSGSRFREDIAYPEAISTQIDGSTRGRLFLATSDQSYDKCFLIPYAIQSVNLSDCLQFRAINSSTSDISRYFASLLRNREIANDQKRLCTVQPQAASRDDISRILFRSRRSREQRRIADILDQADALRGKRRAALARA